MNFSAAEHFKILTLVESEVVQLKPKGNFAKRHPVDFQLIPIHPVDSDPL